jgi:hypothetical protein
VGQRRVAQCDAVGNSKMEVPFIGQRGERRGQEVGDRRWGLTLMVFNIEAKGGESMG